jgi:hypothetical protein
VSIEIASKGSIKPIGTSFVDPDSPNLIGCQEDNLLKYYSYNSQSGSVNRSDHNRLGELALKKFVGDDDTQIAGQKSRARLPQF